MILQRGGLHPAELHLPVRATLCVLPAATCTALYLKVTLVGHNTSPVLCPHAVPSPHMYIHPFPTKYPNTKTSTALSTH